MEEAAQIRCIDDRSTMKNAHKKPIDFGNPLRNLVGQPHYVKSPPAAKILNELLDAMASFHGTCWMPVEKVVDGKSVEWGLMLNQCPGACGHVWKLVLKDQDGYRVACERNQPAPSWGALTTEKLNRRDR